MDFIAVVLKSNSLKLAPNSPMLVGGGMQACGLQWWFSGVFREIAIFHNFSLMARLDLFCTDVEDVFPKHTDTAVY